RIWRDLGTASRHPAFVTEIDRERYAQLLLGLNLARCIYQEMLVPPIRVSQRISHDKGRITREEFAMFFLAESHNTGDPTPHVQAEGARIRELQQAGIVETVYLKADRSGAIILLRAADAAAARDALGSLPLVANGITSFGEFKEVIPIGDGG